jgi:hypothetical protein
LRHTWPVIIYFVTIESAVLHIYESNVSYGWLRCRTLFLMDRAMRDNH